MAIAVAVVAAGAWSIVTALAPDEPAREPVTLAAASVSIAVPAAPAPVSARPSEVGATSPLRLVGVMLGSRQGTPRYALIEDGGRSAVVREDEEMSAGRRLLRVESDRVVIADPARGSTVLQIDAGATNIAAAPAAAALLPPTIVVTATGRVPRTPAFEPNGLAPEPPPDAN